MRCAPHSRLYAIAIATVAAAAAVPATAQAAAPTGCPTVAMTTPFAPWGDSAAYVPAPEGSFETGASSWSLARGAAVAEGNETFKVAGPADHRSLALTAGSSATTAQMCIGVEHRTMRFFVKRTSAPRDASLNVEILYSDAAGKPRSQRIGRITSSRTWAPSPILPLAVNELAAARGNAMQVSFRFTPRGGGFAIDDVLVDPWRRG